MLRLTYSMIKRNQSRNVSRSWTTKAITAKLDQLGWTHQIIPPATMILTFWKDFANREEAIKGRHELERSFGQIMRGVRFDGAKEV